MPDHLEQETMSATVFLDTPMEDESKIECAEAKLIGDIAWVIPDGDGQECVIPQSNVTGVTGDDVEQMVDEVEYAGGRITELVTRLS